MRGLLRASVVLSVGVLGLEWAGCAAPAPPRLRPREPPPPVLVIALDRVALRTAAWVELHALLAAAARTNAELPDPELDAAARAYERALAGDDRDEKLGEATRALAACEDEKCARTALSGTDLAAPFALALPGFLARRWDDRASSARAGVEAARSALGPEVDGLTRQVAKDLGFAWPAPAPIVDIVTDAPPAGREAPIRALLAVRGTCFTTPKPGPLTPAEKIIGEMLGAKPEDAKPDPPRVQDARIIDCVLLYATLRAAAKSEVRDALIAELGPSEGERAFVLVAIHAVAAAVTTWEARHVSVLRRSASAVAPQAMKWLVESWPARRRGEEPATFAKRFAAELRAGVK